MRRCVAVMVQVIGLAMGVLLSAATLAQPRPPEDREPREQWRTMSPDQKAQMFQQMTPDQRDAFRQRMLEERQRRREEGGAPMRRMTPEERQQLRDQINEANRDFRAGHRGRDERPRFERK